MTGTPEGLDASIPERYAPAIAARLARATSDDVATRIFAIDDTLWGPAGQPEVSNRLGWLDVHDRVLAEADDLKAFASQARADGLTKRVCPYDSNLAPKALRITLAEAFTARGASI